MKKSVCMVLTDAVSFNVLCRGQLEFFRAHYDIDLTLVSGGETSQIRLLESRGVGRVVRIPFRRKPDLFRDLTSFVRLFYFFLFNRFDIVIYSTPKAMLISAIVSFLTCQKKRISIVRGRAYENFNGFKRKIYIFFDKLVFNLSNVNLLISKSLYDSYFNDRFNLNKFVVLGSGSSNGVDTRLFYPISTKNDNSPIFHVGVVGRICFDKGIVDLDRVIRCVKFRNPCVCFTMVGHVEDDIGFSIVNQLVNENLAKHVEHMDGISKFFQTLDLHLFLTHREGFGNVAIEAASCSVPTFAFDTVGVRDSVKHQVSGLVFKFGDTDSVAESILEAAADPIFFQKKFSNAREWVVANFDQESVWRRYFDLFLRHD